MSIPTASTRRQPELSDNSQQKHEPAIKLPMVWLEVVFGFILLFVIGSYLYEAIKLPRAMNAKAMGAGDFPMIIAIGSLVAVFVMFCFGLVKLLKEKDHELVAFSRPVWVIAAMVVLVVIGSFLEYLGAISGVGSLVALLMFLAGERRPIQLIAVPLGMALGLYAVFILALGVYFP